MWRNSGKKFKRGGIYGMKKKHLLMLVVLLFSFIVESMPSMTQAHAETTKTELINEKTLQMSYETTTQDDKIHWRISFKRQSADGETLQRLNLKVANEEGKVIEYPAFEQMTEEKDWLVENELSASMEGQLVFKLPKSVQKLYLDVKMDQQEPSKDGEESKIQKNVFSIKKPFELKAMENTGTEEKTTSSKKEELPEVVDGITVERTEKKSKTNEEDSIGPSQEKAPTKEVEQSLKNSIAVTNKFATYASNYNNKSPEYTDNNGIYPVPSWKPDGQTNVINHQGGFETENGWDGLTNWDVSQDDHTNSYIKYGGTKNNPNISLRKYASETSKEDEFNIRLNVRGNSISKPGVDVYFILDNSNSMQDTELKIDNQLRKTLAVQSFQKLINRFKDIQDSDYIRIGGGIYSDYENANYHPTFSLSSNPNNWQTIVDRYSAITPNGNTYTQRAMLEAQTALANAGDNSRRKLIFLLTDGGPNFSMEPTRAVRDTNIYYDSLRITDYNFGTYSTGSRLGGDGHGITKLARLDPYLRLVPITYTMQDGNKISSHLTVVNSTAANIKDSGVEIHGVAIGIKQKIGSELHTTDELIRGLYKIATKKIGTVGDTQSDYFFYHATKGSDFDLSLNDWFTTVVQTVDKGVIEDPIGDMYELVGTPKVTEIKKTGVPAIESGKKPSDPTVVNNTIKVNNINLYANQEIQLDYKVRLKTNHPDYEGGKWYQTNGKTTLAPTPERTTDVMEFGVPSARGKEDKVTIPVEKIWSDSYRNTEDYWGLRKNSVRVILEKHTDNWWDQVDDRYLTPANNWKDKFQDVEGGKTVYRISETARTPGYAKPTSNVDQFTATTIPSKGVQITNKLLTGKAVICKYKEDGKTPFTGDKPKFTVRRKSDGKLLVADLAPDSSGQVTITDIPMGDFVVEETYVPQGYTKMENIELKATENSAGTGLDITLNGQNSPYKVTNKLSKNFKIPIEKIWKDEFKGEDNYWGLRQMYVRVILQKKNGNTWEDVEQKVITSTTLWKETFAAVEGGNAIYRVVEENRSPGYAKPTYNYSGEFTEATIPNSGIKLTNKLLTGKAVICKYMDDGQTPFTKDKPKFTVKRKSDGKILVENLEPNNDGQVTITDIPMGDFIVEESYVPQGYEKMADIELKAVENSAGDALVITLNGKSSPYKVTNKMSDFTLKIKKVDQNGDELRGASFRLVGTGYDETRVGGPIFEFTGLRPGEYSLSETVVPSGYQGMSGTVRISISQTGTVTIQPNPNVTGSGGLGNPNLIQLTVTNKKRGQGPLPRTGGSGTAMFFKVAIGVISTAGGLLGSLYWLHTKRRGS